MRGVLETYKGVKPQAEQWRLDPNNNFVSISYIVAAGKVSIPALVYYMWDWRWQWRCPIQRNRHAIVIAAMEPVSSLAEWGENVNWCNLQESKSMKQSWRQYCWFAQNTQAHKLCCMAIIFDHFVCASVVHASLLKNKKTGLYRCLNLIPHKRQCRDSLLIRLKIL